MNTAFHRYSAPMGAPEAAAFLGLSVRTLERLEAQKRGPLRIRISCRRVAYRPKDLRAWLEAQASAATASHLATT